MRSFVDPFRQQSHRLRLAIAAILLLFLLPTGTAHAACATAPVSADLGSASSLALASQTRESTGASGLTCSALALVSASFIKMRVDSSTFLLTGGPNNQTISFLISATPGGPAIPAGSEYDFSGFSLLNLFTGPGGSVPLYFRTATTPALQAGIYTGTAVLRWYYSVCTVGLGPLCVFENSPGATRNLFGLTNWGTGTPATVTVKLIVENDCAITAPPLNFGTAPLPASFNPITQTISIRCSAGTDYTVGLSNGINFNGTTRRMRRDATTDYLNYEIYQTAASSDRWGNTGAGRRDSNAAQTNPGIYDGSTLQGFTYRATIDPTQTTSTAGTYIDTVVVDVEF